MKGTVGVIGAGTMGGGIAQLCAQSGFKVKLYDAAQGAVERAIGRMKRNFDETVSRGKMSQDKSASAIALIHPAAIASDLAEADIVIEAVIEDLPLKQRIFAELDQLLASSKVLASNTSSLSVRDIAAKTINKGRVMGIHFFNPPPVMKLVEMIRTPETQESTFRSAWEFVAGLGRTPVEVKDAPGFIVNRTLRPFYLESVRMLSSGIGPMSAIDASARDLGHVPMGPFELMDFIGLDVSYAVTNAIYQALGCPARFEPHPLHQHLIKLGHLGRKSGRGFYLYQDGRMGGENPEVTGQVPLPGPGFDAVSVWNRLLSGIIDEAQRIADEGVATEEAINTAMKLGTRFPKGPFEWKAEAGARSMRV